MVDITFAAVCSCGEPHAHQTKGRRFVGGSLLPAVCVYTPLERVSDNPPHQWKGVCDDKCG